VAPVGHAPVGAAHHPVELGGPPPRRPALLPLREDLAADAEHVGILVGLHQGPDPVGVGDGVVVEEGHDGSASGGDPAVAGRGQPLPAGVGDGPHAADLVLDARQKGRIVVDDDDHFARSRNLVHD
jgi:hypothetical protein